MDGLPGEAGRDEVRLAVTSADRLATEALLTACWCCVLLVKPRDASRAARTVRQAACSRSKQ